MVIDVKFDFAKVYDITKFDVSIGQKFSLLTDDTTSLKWFSDNDPALAMDVKDTGIVEVEATTVGTSIILIMDANFNPLKQLTINVVDKILNPATDLNLSAGTPIDK